MWSRAFVLTFSFAAIAVPSPAQEATLEGELAPGFKDLIEVSEVLLDVIATDADGRVVLGLGEDDFVIEEDGEAVEITGVSFYATRYADDLPVAETLAAAAAEEVPSSRYFILFWDAQPRDLRYGNLMLRQHMRASRDLKRWVMEEMSASDWMAVVRYDGELAIYQDFTQESEALVEAIRRAAVGKAPNAFAPASRRSGPIDHLSLARRLPPRDRTGGREDIYRALGRVAEASGYIVGRKNLLLLTTGFGEEERHSRSRPHPERYPALETLLNDHNVAVYPIDLTPPGRSPRQRDFLDQLARDTGGYYDENFVGFLNPVKDVAEENYGYYLLSYQSARRLGEIGYQRLEVRARDPEIQVRARTGYRYGL
jgi:VWFA-related protein